MSRDASPSGERTLRSYLLVPRPKDLIKAWIFPAAFALGAVAERIDLHDLVRAGVVWVVLELLIYQARYQWNDIRGFHADQRHPDATSRGRLPGPRSQARRHIGASVAVIATRLAGAALLIALLPQLDLAEPVLALACGVFGIAWIYEVLRDAATSKAPSHGPPSPRASTVALWVVVGAGYAVRGLGGLGMAVDLTGRPALFVAAGLCLWAFGVAFVTTRWALEALPFARRGDAGVVLWEDERARGREHTLALAKWLPTIAPADAAGPDGGLVAWRALAKPTSPSAPWNLGTAVAAAAAGFTGALLADITAPGEIALTCVAGLSFALLVLFTNAPVLLWLAGAAVLASLALLTDGNPVLFAVPWTLVVGSHLLFTRQSTASLSHPIRSTLTPGGMQWAPTSP